MQEAEHDTEQVRLISSDGVSLLAHYYAGVTPGPCYLLGHGFTGSGHRPQVIEIAQKLRSRGACVLVIDFRGHGGSGGTSSVGVTEIADVSAGLQWLRERHPEAAVAALGFSMGASIVLRHAGLCQGSGSADAVVAVSGPGRWYERGTVPMRRLHRGLETRLGRVVIRRLFKIRVGGGWDLLPVSPVEVAAAIDVPLLIVHGDADPYFGLEHPRMLASVAPRAHLWIEAGMGHAESATGPELLDRIDDWVRGNVCLGR
ncbi:alpha/beta hydrolase family protein [Jatrophihabitans sp. DSM 45814]